MFMGFLRASQDVLPLSTWVELPITQTSSKPIILINPPQSPFPPPFSLLTPTRAAVSVNFDFQRQFANTSELTSVVDTALFPSGMTQTSTAIDYVREHIFGGVNGSRPAPVRKIAVVITDGQSNPGY